MKTAEYHKSPGVKGYWRAVAADQANAKMACSAEEAKAKPTSAPTRKPLQRQDAIWQAGNSDTPVRCELVRDVLEARRKKTHASHPRARGDVGPASTARAIADEQCPTLLVSDSRETVGDLQPIELKKTCGRGHPGMRAATHATVYQATEEICVNLTTLFSHCQKRDALGRIVCFTCYHGPGPRVHQWSVVTTEVRFARPAIQMVACTDSLGEGRFKIRCGEWGMSGKSSYHAVADELMELTAKHNIDTSDIDQVVVNEGFYAPQIADMPDVLGTWAPFPEALFRKFRPHLQWGVDREIYPHVIPPSERKGRRKRTPEDGDELDKLFKSIKSEKEKNKERMDKWKAALSKLKKIGKVAKKAVKAYGGVTHRRKMRGLNRTATHRMGVTMAATNPWLIQMPRCSWMRSQMLYSSVMGTKWLRNHDPSLNQHPAMDRMMVTALGRPDPAPPASWTRLPDRRRLSQ